jgi:transcriptional regulator with XRE-family HTH domain
MELGERIRAARTAAGLTQQQVADHFKIKRPTVTQWEVGTHRPDQDKFTDLADLLGVTLNWLISESGAGPEPGKKPVAPAPSTAKFLRTSRHKFYVKEWREFMGSSEQAGAEAAGLDLDEYGAYETYPINFTLAQIVALADEFGMRGDQFWFPPPKGKPAVTPGVVTVKKRVRK